MGSLFPAERTDSTICANRRNLLADARYQLKRYREAAEDYEKADFAALREDPRFLKLTETQ